MRAPVGCESSNFTWSVSGSAVSNYVIASDSSSAQVLPLVQTNSPSVSFYWVSGGQQNVTCSVLLNNGSIATSSASFIVQSPTVYSFNSTTGPVVVGSSFGDLELSFGTPSTVGISYTAQVFAPPLAGGQLKFTQTINRNFQRTHTNNATDSLVVPAWWLDNQDPVPFGGPFTVAAGMPLFVADSDSPGVGLFVGYEEMNAIFDNFALYLMFKPPGNAIWVPLSRISWGWSGVAQSIDGGTTWTKTSGAPNVTNPSGVNTTANTTNFPEWSSVFLNNKYPAWQPDP